MAHALQGLVDSIVAATAGLPDPETLATWNPELSGDLDMVITRDGRWLHAGAPIQREGLVRLFASLLRREADGAYYLVTPVEKWRIRVERHALLVIDCDHRGSNGDGTWVALLNTGGRCRIGGRFSLHTPDGQSHDAGGDEGAIPWLDLPNGLTAQLTRSAWYRLVESATVTEDGRAILISAGVTIDLGSIG